jgi:hypothetical protein
MAFMPISLQDLTHRLKISKTSLLLGAGAGVPSGAPTGLGLAERLAARLQIKYTSGLNLSTFAALAEMKIGRRALVDAIKEEILPLTPQGGILAIPHFNWQALYSTNYDLLLERAYNRANRPFTVVRSNYDFPLLEQNTGTPIFKIHGCITQDRAYGHNTSIILTDQDYVEFSRYREFLFDRMKTNLQAGQVLIIGQSLADIHLRDLVRDVARLQAQLGKSDGVYLLCYNADPDLGSLFEYQKINVAFGGIDEFMDALTAVGNGVIEHASLDETEGFLLPPELLACTVSVDEAVKLPSRPLEIFNGRQVGYSDIKDGYTFARDVENEILARLRARNLATALIGVAGVGKTTAARRALMQLRTEGFGVWEHRPELPLRPHLWLSIEEWLRARNQFGVLLLDEVTRVQRRANELIESLATRENSHLLILATASVIG